MCIGVIKEVKWFYFILASILTLVGSVVGQGIADHVMVRKLGFTGSTPVGKTIMERQVLCCPLRLLITY